MNRPLLFAVLAVTSSFSFASAQEPPVVPTPPLQKEHAWLLQFTGQWTVLNKAQMQLDQPAMECTGSMKSRMLGGLWVVNEMEVHMMGNTVYGLQTIGYDPVKEKYVGTWIDSGMNHMWHYEGAVDDSGKKLTLSAEGPNLLTEGKLAKYRDSYEFQTPDLIIATSEMEDEHGEWITFMTGELRREK